METVGKAIDLQEYEEGTEFTRKLPSGVSSSSFGVYKNNNTGKCCLLLVDQYGASLLKLSDEEYQTISKILYGKPVHQ